MTEEPTKKRAKVSNDINLLPCTTLTEKFSASSHPHDETLHLIKKGDIFTTYDDKNIKGHYICIGTKVDTKDGVWAVPITDDTKLYLSGEDLDQVSLHLTGDHVALPKRESVLSTLRRDEHSDIRLTSTNPSVTGWTVYPCHRFLLMKSSTKFYEALLDPKVNELKLDGKHIDKKSIEAVLDWMYKGHFIHDNITVDAIFDLGCIGMLELITKDFDIPPNKFTTVSIMVMSGTFGHMPNLRKKLIKALE